MDKDSQEISKKLLSPSPIRVNDYKRALMVPRIIMKRLLNSREAAQYLGISERKLEYLHSKGFIKQTRLPETRKRLYDIYDLDMFIESIKNN